MPELTTDVETPEAPEPLPAGYNNKTSKDEESEGLETWAITLIVIGILLFVGGLALYFYHCNRRSKNSKVNIMTPKTSQVMALPQHTQVTTEMIDIPDSNPNRVNEDSNEADEYVGKEPN